MGTIAENTYDRSNRMIEHAASLELAVRNHKWAEATTITMHILNLSYQMMTDMAGVESDAAKEAMASVDTGECRNAALTALNLLEVAENAQQEPAKGETSRKPTPKKK